MASFWGTIKKGVTFLVDHNHIEIQQETTVHIS